MKKKGLIISTIVMVVVLIASLTTATYAWFTNTGTAAVDNITFKVESASDLVIGVKKNNTYGATPGWSDFVSDNTEYTPADLTRGTWGGTDGLGLHVNTTLDLSHMTKAVYSFSSVSSSDYIYSEDAAVTNEAGHYYVSSESPLTYAECPKAGDAPTKTYTRTQGYTGTPTTYVKGEGQAVTTGLVTADESASARILKANGSGNTITAGTLEAAVKNADYLDVVFGVTASNTGVVAYGCYVYIDNDLTLSSLGMNAAIHVVYRVDNGAYTELDLYGANGAGDPNSSATAPAQPHVKVGAKDCKLISDTDWAARTIAAGDVALYIPIYNESGTVAPTGTAGIHQLQLIIYICGPDGDCITAATGTGATISIEFLNINKSVYDASPNA